MNCFNFVEDLRGYWLISWRQSISFNKYLILYQAIPHGWYLTTLRLRLRLWDQTTLEVLLEWGFSLIIPLFLRGLACKLRPSWPERGYVPLRIHSPYLKKNKIIYLLLFNTSPCNNLHHLFLDKVVNYYIFFKKVSYLKSNNRQIFLIKKTSSLVFIITPRVFFVL